MSNCGCIESTPAATAPPNCSPIPAYVDPPTTETEPCCLACVYDELTVEWTKPEEETEIPLPVCDSSRYMQGQCVFVLGTNGLGGTYSITAILDDAITVEPHDGANFDVGGPGNVVGGRVFLLPSCPLTQQALIDIVSPEFPDDFVLEVHASSDTTHGFSLSVVDGKIKLVYNQTNFEAQVLSYLQNLGVTFFKPVVNTVKLDLFNMPNPDPLANATGTIDVATDFGVVVPANATHVRLRVHFEVMAGNSVGAVAGDESHIVASLGFNGSPQFAIEQYSQNVTPAVNSTEGFALRNASWTHVNMDIPLTAGQVTWSFTHTLYPTTGKAAAGNDADAYVRLLGFLITP